MSITGDWSKLERALKELDALGSATVMDAAAKNVAVAMTTEVQLTFRKEQTPDGTPWAPLKRGRKRKGKGKRGNKILRDTGRLANSITGVAAGNNVIVGTNVEYAPHHQFGTRGHGASTRQQPIKKSGAFISKAKAGKQKSGSVAFRTLNFQDGNGAIPARPFLPLESLPMAWQNSAARVIVTVLKQTAPTLLAGAAE